MLLSSVYPLGEKSGVNLRGNFNLGKGTVWEQDPIPTTTTTETIEESDKTQEEEKEQAVTKEGEEKVEKMEVEEGEEDEQLSKGELSLSLLPLSV